MKVRKRELFDAEQWFPGKKGVTGDDPNKWCGCVIAGGPPDIPHIHPSHLPYCELINPGDWVVTDGKGKRCLVGSDIFDKIYEKMPKIYD